MLELVIVCSCACGLAEEGPETHFRGSWEKVRREIVGFERRSDYSADL